MKRTFLFLVAQLLSVALTASATFAQGPLVSDLAYETFEAAWRIVNEQHFDPQFNGVDWPAVREEFEPRARAAADAREGRKIVNEMLGRLEQSHFSVIGSEESGQGAHGARATPLGTVAMTVRYRDGSVFVQRVEAGGPAAEAGVLPGWVLSSIDGKALDSIVSVLPPNPIGRVEASIPGLLLPYLDGDVGSSARFVFEDGAGEEREVELERVRRRGLPFDVPGLPTLYLRTRAERVERDGLTIGVLHFSNWFRGIIRLIDAALVGFRDCDGIVIDLRDNSGGASSIAQQVAGHFFDRRTPIGTTRTRRGDADFTVRPRIRFGGKRVEPFLGPLVILVDETTGSCSEVFTGGMQSVGRARVIGERTAGSALPATLTELPSGDYLLHAIADFLTRDGASLEGDGVIPDQIIAFDREALLEGKDLALDAAVRWIESEGEGNPVPARARRTR